MKQVAVFFAEGFEEVEALTVVDLLRRAQIQVEMVSIADGLEVTGAHQIKVTCDMHINDFHKDEVQMVILPGGMPGTKHLGESMLLQEIILDFYDKKKWLAAICAAPGIFGELGLLSGKRACSYPSVEGKLKGAIISHEKVEVTEHMITSRGLGTAIAFSLALIAVLKDEETAESIAHAVLY
jgi:protein deglycase